MIEANYSTIHIILVVAFVCHVTTHNFWYEEKWTAQITKAHNLFMDSSDMVW